MTDWKMFDGLIGKKIGLRYTIGSSGWVRYREGKLVSVTEASIELQEGYQLFRLRVNRLNLEPIRVLSVKIEE